MTTLDLAAERFREYSRFDSPLLMKSLGYAGLAAATGLRVLGRRSKALQVEMALHRAALARGVDRVVERRVKRALAAAPRLEGYVQSLSPQPATQVFFKNPARLIGTRILVLKSPRGDEKGLIVIDYSFVFSLFARAFDVDAITSRYHIALEPSWSGYCDRDVLALAGLDVPVFVQNYEQRDIAFIEQLRSNLISVPIAANWWVDSRVFCPLPDVSRDADVLLIAAWARYKRHAAFFAALGRLRARGRRVKIILVGYPVDMSRQDIERLAAERGIADQIEIHENVKPPEVNRLLNRVKVNVLWSRREGFNRAVIEGLFAGVPGIMRLGFNYGYRYPYINADTGLFASEEDLPDRLLEIVDGHRRFNPRPWVEANMSPPVATRLLDECVHAYARQHGQPWTPGGLAVKVTSLNAMAYWDEARRATFSDDYAFLASCVRGV